MNPSSFKRLTKSYLSFLKSSVVYSRFSNGWLLYFAYGSQLDLSLASCRAIFSRIKYISKGKDPSYFKKMIRYYAHTNVAGQSFLNALTAKHHAFDFLDKTVIDLGSGLGGLCRALRLQSPKAVFGLEIDSFKLAFSRTNTCDLLNVCCFFFDVDNSPRIFDSIDYILSDQVLEHVKSPSRFCEFISSTLSVDGTAYVALPNGTAMQNVLSDPHLGLPFITLLNSHDASVYASTLAGHTSYHAMMGPNYLTYSEILDLCVSHGLSVRLVSSIPTPNEFLRIRESFLQSAQQLLSKYFLEDAKAMALASEYLTKLTDSSEDDLQSLIHFGVSNFEFIFTRSCST